MAKISKKRIILALLLIHFSGVVMLLSYSAVDNSLTYEDSRYSSLFMKGVPVLSEHPNYHDELKFIESVQRAVLDTSPQTSRGPILNNLNREPKDLFLAKTGYCYDRSRAIEKILRLNGFQVRHVFIIRTNETKSLLKSLIKPGVTSHAVTEVLTQRGWLIVGSNNVWTSLDKNYNPISIRELKYRVDNSIPLELARNSTERIYYQSFGYVYGLYSRHGKFYPPFNFVPDVNYEEFVQNFESFKYLY